jgi:hypothetical protein
MKIALISCTKSKMNHPAKARKMYSPSDLFSKGVAYIESSDYDRWYILSALHGLLDPDKEIEPYELSMRSLSVTERKEWTEGVLDKLDAMRISGAIPIDRIDFLCGMAYREYLVPRLGERDIDVRCPLEGLTLGQQLKFYDTQIALRKDPVLMKRFGIEEPK